MSFAECVVLGAIAGFTIYLRLPVRRLTRVSDAIRAFLGLTSAGIIVFLLFDIFSKLSEPIAEGLKQATAGQASPAEFVSLLVIFVLGFGVGLLGLVAFEQRFIRYRTSVATIISPVRLSLMIAIGLGLHNFSE